MVSFFPSPKSPASFLIEDVLPDMDCKSEMLNEEHLRKVRFFVWLFAFVSSLHLCLFSVFVLCVLYSLEPTLLTVPRSFLKKKLRSSLANCSFQTNRTRAKIFGGVIVSKFKHVEDIAFYWKNSVYFDIALLNCPVEQHTSLEDHWALLGVSVQYVSTWLLPQDAVP